MFCGPAPEIYRGIPPSVQRLGETERIQAFSRPSRKQEYPQVIALLPPHPFPPLCGVDVSCESPPFRGFAKLKKILKSPKKIDRAHNPSKLV